ncbi:TolC family outer membrane protein [Maricaulis sp. CAU 1757]
MVQLKRWALALAGGTAVFMSASAMAQTLEDTLVLAYNTNPTLQAERARLRATNEDLVQARAAWLPSISATGSVSQQHSESESFNPLFGTSTVNESDVTPKALSVTANQTVWAGGRIGGTIDRAEAVILAGRETLRSVEQDVIVTAVIAFMDVRRDAEVIEIRRNNVELLAQQLQAARDRFEVGEITRTDVAQAEARLSGAQAQLSSAQAQLAASRAAYERVTGEPPASLAEAPQLPPLPESLADAAELAFGYSPQLRAAQFFNEAAEHSIRIARSSLAPEFSVQARASTSRDNVVSGDYRDSTSITGQVSVPIFTGGLNRSRVRAARAEEEASEFQVRETRRQVIEAVTNAWNAYVASLAVIESSAQAVRANEIAFDGVEQEAFVGLRTTLDVLNAEQELLESRLILVTAERDSYVAGYRLMQAMGLLSAEQLALDVEIYDPAARNRSWFAIPNLDLTPWN